MHSEHDLTCNLLLLHNIFSILDFRTIARAYPYRAWKTRKNVRKGRKSKVKFSQNGLYFSKNETRKKEQHGKDALRMMPFPSRDQCLSLMEQVCMQAHIQKHSFMVTEIALYLGRLLNRNGIRLNVDLLEAGALLHDIAKPRSIVTGERHAELGARMLEDWGYPEVAQIVREHVNMDPQFAGGPVTESVLVNYADKRVKHYEIVTLEERFTDLIARYARTEEHGALLNRKLSLYQVLERRIFFHLEITPVEAELMQLPLPLYHWPGGGSEDYEQQEIESCIAGRGKVR